MTKAQPLLRYLPYLMALYALVEFYPLHPALLYAPHALFALGCLALILIYPETRFIGAHNILPVLFLVFWLIFNLASYVWAQDRDEVLLYSLWILRYLILFLAFGKLFTQQKFLDRVPWFLAGMVLLYVATALWELSSFSHLPTSRYYGRISYMPTGPFYNENNLAAYLMLFSPFLLFMPKLARHRGWGYLSGVVIVIIMIIMTIQLARIGMLALGAFMLYFFLFQVKWRHKLAFVLVVGLIGGGIYLRYQKQIGLIWKVMQHQTASIGSERSAAYMGSVQIREQLLVESFEMSARKGFMGVGGGNFEPEMRGEAMLRTGWMTNPHNFLMELFGNWGILIFGGFVWLYLHWLAGLWRLYRRSEGRQRSRYLMYLCSLVLFLPASVLPSSIRWNYFVWIYFAAVNAMLHTGSKQRAPEIEEVPL